MLDKEIIKSCGFICQVSLTGVGSLSSIIINQCPNAISELEARPF